MMKLSFFLLFSLVASGIASQVNPLVWNSSAWQPKDGQLFETTIKLGYLSGRTVRVWVPSNYTRSKTSYDVVYFHDGQMLFDSTNTWNHQSWNLAEVGKKYLRKKKVILVGIDNAPLNRYAEFFPAPIFPKLPAQVQLALRDSLWNGLPLFESYTNALTKEVFPLIEQNFKVNTGGAHRYMAGSSMGAIVSFTFLLTHPNELSGVACLSMHLPLIDYWRFKNRFKEPISNTFNAFVKEKSMNIENKRIYIDRGDQSLDEVYDDYFVSFEQLLLPMKEKNNLWVKLIPNSGHSERDWSRRIGPIIKTIIK